MTRGYARVSTAEQHLDLQLAALRAAGVATGDIFTDRASGAGDFGDRPGLVALLAALEPGDALVVWRLDRLCRGLAELLRLLASLAERGVRLVSLTESIDTRSAAGQLVLHVFGALGQFEREQLRERAAAGIEAARARGVHIGRPAVMTPDQVRAARTMASDGASIRTVARLFRVSRSAATAAIAGDRPYDRVV